MVASSKRRKVEDAKPLTWKDLEEKLEKIVDPRAQCLISLLYLSGRRIGEVLALQKKDFRIDENRISFETFNEKSYRSKPTQAFTIKRSVRFRNFKDRKRHPFISDAKPEDIKYPQVKFFDGELYYERIRPHWRTDSESGKALTKYLTKTLDSLGNEDYLFKRQQGRDPIHYNTAYNTVRFYLPDAWPHLERHERFTEIFKIYKDDIMTAHKNTFHRRMESDLPYLRDLEQEKERI